MRNMQQQSWE